jgi:Ser/Thr protein kinase RdoA (MazF antagonist)
MLSIAQYQQAAIEALQAYQFNHQAVRVELLSAINNVTFKVFIAEAAGEWQLFALRIHRPGTAREGQIRAELAWLSALRQETELKTPRPVMTKTGEPLAAVTVGPGNSPLYCVLFEWLEGQFVPTK